LAVFSEIYYENGWNAYIDGVKQSISLLIMCWEH
jgi:hypothetical protein